MQIEGARRQLKRRFQAARAPASCSRCVRDRPWTRCGEVQCVTNAVVLNNLIGLAANPDCAVFTDCSEERIGHTLSFKTAREESNMLSRHHLTVISAAALLLAAKSVFAHCDTLDGPVVQAARAALESGDLNPVLIWVQAEHEAEIRTAFQQTRRVRMLGESATELADRYFFETVVRLHREGEGAPYTGLKPAGMDFGVAIPAADGALESGSPEEVIALLTETLRAGLHEHFEDAASKKEFDAGNIAAGRSYVASYVEYIHYVERIYDAATSPALHHFPAHE